MLPETPLPLNVPPEGEPDKFTGVVWLAQKGPPGCEKDTPGKGLTLTATEAQTVVLQVPMARTK